MPALIPSPIPFFKKHLPSPHVRNLVKTAPKSFPASLKDSLRAKVFMALIQLEFSYLEYDDQERLCIEFGVVPFASHSQCIIGLASQSLNLPVIVAAQVLGSYLKVHAEYIFEVFPAVTVEKPVQWTSPTDESLLPQRIVLDDDCYVLAGIERQDDFIGYTEQAVCHYRNNIGSIFHLLAVRTGIENFYGKEMPYLTIGRQAIPAYLFDRAKVDRNQTATIILPMDLDSSVALRALIKDSRIISDSEIIVSGLIGGAAVLKYTELTPLSHHHVVIVPEFHRQGLLDVEEAVAQCRKAGAADVLVYPWPLFHREPQPVTTAWAEEFQRHGIRLDEIDSPACLLRKIVREAVNPHDFRRLLEEQGVIVEEPKGQSRPSSLPRFAPDSIEASPQPQEIADVTAEHILTGIVMMHGEKNQGKSMIEFTAISALILGKKLFGFFPVTDSPSKAYLVDSETPTTLFKDRLQQFGLIQEYDLYAVVKTSGVEMDLRDEKFRQALFDDVTTKGYKTLFLDNLTSLIGKAGVYHPSGVKDIFPFLELLNKKGVTTFVVHHSKENPGNAPEEARMRGTSEFSIRAHTEIALVRPGGTKGVALPDEVEAATRQMGVTVGLYFKVCKAACILEGKTLWLHLPLGSGEVQPLALLDSGGASVWTSDHGHTCCFNESEETSEGEKPNVSPNVCENLVLSNDENRVMKLFTDTKRQIIRKDVEVSLDCGEDKAGAVLKALKDKGMITQTGGGRSTAYTQA